MKKMYKKPITEILRLATSALMMDVSSGSAPENAVGNAPKKRYGVF